MASTPELDEFQLQTEALARNPILAPHVSKGQVGLAALSMEEVDRLARGKSAGYYLLIAAANLNRTSLKRATQEPKALLVPGRLRKAFAIRERLPVRASFRELVAKAVALREADIGRKSSGGIESLFRERLRTEGIPILMSPPIRHVPGLLISKRKPDGVYPDPALNLPPRIYLEIKNIRRVSDDIQKRLYELAEASLEMKALYGDLQLEGLQIKDPSTLAGHSVYRERLRAQITASLPTVVGLFLCSRNEAERYRQGAETFIDRIFFQEEIEECLRFLKSAVARVDQSKS